MCPLLLLLLLQLLLLLLLLLLLHLQLLRMKKIRQRLLRQASAAARHSPPRGRQMRLTLCRVTRLRRLLRRHLL
jgi:hypothetical protein